jgi:hypothetical protein
MKISLAIQKQNKIRRGVVTLTKEASAEYLLQRLQELGGRVVEARRLTWRIQPSGPENSIRLCQFIFASTFHSTAMERFVPQG